MIVLRHLCPVALLLTILAHPAPCTPDSFQRDGVTFTRQSWGPRRPQPALTEEERERGWVTFVPGDPDGIGPLAFPTRAEIDATVTAFASPGEFEPVTFGVYAARDLQGVVAEAGQFIGSRNSRIGPANVDVRAVRLWDQRTSWRSDRFYTIPELLEKTYAVDIRAGTFQQFWVTIRVPEDATDGAYEGYVRLTIGDRYHMVPIHLRVLPFKLHPPQGKVYGLWPDTARWANYSEQQILDEIGNWREHGIESTLMYPLTHGKFTLEDGELKADLSEFERVMNLYVRAGMGGPVIASCQGIGGLVHRLLGQDGDDWGPRFADLMLQIVGRIEDLRVANRWPEFIYHTVDEPGGHAAAQAEAVATLSILHNAGYKTYTTSDVDWTNETIAQYLSVRCYGIGFCATSAEQALARRAECDASGATYWWYGSGCYTGQEGSLAVNRHLSGFLLDKSLADGAWAWTFQRPKGDAYDDFDGASQREPKDACITYPSADGWPPLVPTLQWEGIREGIDDIRYLQNLRAAIADLRLSEDPRCITLSDRVESDLQAILEDVPWLGEGGFSSTRAQVARWKIVALTMECAAAVTDTHVPVPPAIPLAAEAPGPTLECTFSRGETDQPEGSIPVAYARRVPRAPAIDGQLDRAYLPAYLTAGFTDPQGRSNPLQTKAWLCRDDDNLYVAVWCEEDEMNKLRAEVTDHDGQIWTDDSVELFIDTNTDQQTYYHFMLNSVGTRGESSCRLMEPGTPFVRPGAAEVDKSWDGRWEGAAGPCEGGWCAELCIPLDTINVRAADVLGLNINRTRRVPTGVQYSCWSPTFGGYHVPGRFGRLVMVPRSLELISVDFPAPHWTRNEALIRVLNTGLVAEVDVWGYAGDAAGAVPTRFLLAPGQNEIAVDYSFAREGLQRLHLELQPAGVWVDAEAAAAVGRDGGGKLQGASPQLQGRTRTFSEAPTRLSYNLLVPPPMQITATPAELLVGQPGFDLQGSFHMGHNWGRTATLVTRVMRDRDTLVEKRVSRPSGDQMFLSVGTGSLEPGQYRVTLSLERHREQLATAEVPFTVIAGPWAFAKAQ